MQIRQSLPAVVAVSLIAARAADAQLLRLEEQFRTGDEMSGSPLSAVSAVTLGPNGSIFVLQPDSAEVRLLGRDGRLIRRFGGYGLGAGQFRNPRRMGWLRDTLWIVDDQHNRVSFFSSAGQFLSSTQLPRPWALDIAVLHEHTLLADGALLVYASPVATGDSARRAAVVRLGVGGSSVDTLLLIEEGADAYRVQVRVKGHVGHQVGRQPFADTPMWATSPDGSRIVLVDRATTRSDRTFEITMLDTQGTRVYQIQVPFEPRPISEQHVTAVLDSIYRFTARPEVELRRADLRRALHTPRILPPVTDVIVGDDRRTWLRRSRGPGGTVTYTVVEPNGRVLGELQLLRGGTVAAATSDRILVIEDGASAQPQLVGYRLVHDRRRRAASPE